MCAVARGPSVHFWKLADRTLDVGWSLRQAPLSGSTRSTYKCERHPLECEHALRWNSHTSASRSLLGPARTVAFSSAFGSWCTEAANHDGLVTCLAVVSDDTVFSGSDDCRIKVWGCALAE